jgi:ribosomal protein L37AE/L43A
MDITTAISYVCTDCREPLFYTGFGIWDCSEHGPTLLQGPLDDVVRLRPIAVPGA